MREAMTAGGWPRRWPGEAFILALIAAVWAGFTPVWASQDSPALLGGSVSYSTLPKDLTWEQAAPHVREVRIVSSADGSEQPALFHDPGGEEKRPLLVALHSWSDNYRQTAGIPYALWAARNGWVFIHPDFRGVNDKPQATASELAIQDILDALEYAKRNASIDESRVYLIGFSGGAMSALVMAGRHPDLWTAVSAWVPVHDLNDWFRYNRRRHPERHYVAHIQASCGGAPWPGSGPARDCARRSPSSHLQGARGKDVRIQIAVGVRDDFVPPSHSLRAFNELASARDRFGREDMRLLDEQGRLPPGPGPAVDDPADAGPAWPKVFERTSGNATLVLFDGKHDIYYAAGLHWLSRQVRPAAGAAD